jgi:hypothetical protein
MPLIWSQTYLLFGSGLWVSALFAAIPIFALLVLLGVMRKPAWMSGLAGVGITFLLAVFGYRMPALTAASAAANGAAFGIFPIIWIVFWAIALYRLTVETGKFEIIRDSVGRLTADARLQALLIAFAFGAFLEGAAGFGTPVAIAAAMMTGLGFSRFRAAALALLSNAAPGAYGGIGIPIITLAATTGLPLRSLSTVVSRICAPVSFIIPAYLILSMGGVQAMSGIWLPTLVAGGLFACVQWAVSTYLGPQLTDILSALAAMGGIVLISRFRHPELHDSSTSFRNSGAGMSAGTDGTRVEITLDEGAASEGSIAQPGMGAVLYAWLPYGILVLCVLLWGLKPFQSLLNTASGSRSNSVCRSIYLELAVGGRDGMHGRDSAFGALPEGAAVALHALAREGSASVAAANDHHHVGAGYRVSDELLRRNGYAGVGICRNRRHVSLLQRLAGMAGSFSYRLGHFVQCAVRQFAGGHREPAWAGPDSDVVGQRGWRGDGQDDQPADDCRRCGSYRHVGARSIAAFPIYVQAQRCAGNSCERGGAAAFLSNALDILAREFVL